MSAFRWLARGDWASASTTGLVVEAGMLQLAPSAGAAARRGVAVVEAGVPDAAQVDATTADRWRRVTVRLAEPLAEAAWVRVWTQLAATTPTAPPGIVPGAPGEIADDAPVETPVGAWRAAAVDALDVRVLPRVSPTALPPLSLWIAIELGGRGTATPRLADLLVETDDDGAVTRLPVVYRTTEPLGGSPSGSPGGAQGTQGGGRAAVDEGDGLLGRYAGLLDAERRRTSSLLDELAGLLSPVSASDRPDAPWLERLAGWVALDDEQLPDDTPGRRDAVARAPERHARRGTRDGLIDEVVRRTGIDRARIDVVEPLQQAEIWRLPRDGGPAASPSTPSSAGSHASTSILGQTTGLLLADPGPPVLDTTAFLDAAQLIDDDEAGLPVHGAVAHRICVHVVDGTPTQVRLVDAVVQRERPAHVLARTCAVTHVTDMGTVVGLDALPGPAAPGLANDVVHSPAVDGPGHRIGAARLPAGGAPVDDPRTAHAQPASPGRAQDTPHTHDTEHAQEGEAP